MDLNKVKDFIKANKVPFIAGLSCAMVAITASAIYFSIKPSDNILKLKKDEFKIELGERISKDAAYYLDTKDLSKEEAKEVIEKSKVNVPKIKKVGNYKIKISYDIQSIEAKLKVIDTVPPSFEEVNNMTVPLGTNFTDDDLKEMFIVMDGDEKTQLDIDNGGYDANKEGTYTIKATAKDSSGNKTEYSFTITVTAGVQEIQYTENTVVATAKTKDGEKQTVTPTTTTEKKPTSTTTGSGSTNSNSNSSSSSSSNSTSKPSNGGGNNYLKSISISGSKSIKKDNSVDLTAHINPSNASVSPGSFKWSSSNEGVARIAGGNGYQTVSVFGVGEGSATITCTVNGVSASYVVTVSAPQQTETTDYSAIELKFIDKNGRAYSKKFNQMTSGNSLTFNLADYGCVYNGGASFVGSGFAISVDSNKWYQETGYPNNVYNIHNGGTFKFRSSAGTEVTITCVVNRANMTIDEFNCVFKGAC